MSDGAQGPTYEIASVLFMDIVSYSICSIDDQAELLTLLQSVVQQCPEYKQALEKNEVISLPTGDGMALVFFRDPISPVLSALEIARALKSHQQIQLRMGIHQGPVRRHADIKDQANVVGGGINIAQRVMDCGDSGHILVSRNVAEVLEQVRGWSDCLSDLGTHEVKHGVLVQLFNLCKVGLGNTALPRKLQPAALGGASKPQIKHRSRLSRTQQALMAALAMVLLSAGAFFFFSRHNAESALESWKSNLLSARPKGSKPVTAPMSLEDDLIGLTLWRLRPSVLTDSPSVRAIIHENAATKEWTPERCSFETPMENGQHFRITIESARTGYLYIVDREVYADGTTGDPFLIFPTVRLNAGNNRIKPGMIVAIPSDQDDPPYLTMRSDAGSKALANDLLTILVAPAPITGLEIGQDRQKLSNNQLHEWQEKWRTAVRHLEVKSEMGKAPTDSEKFAASNGSVLTSDDPLPQTMYRVEAKPGAPMLVDVALRVGR